MRGSESPALISRLSVATIAGGVPGIDTALFGALLILVIAFARDGVQGVIGRLFARMTRKTAPPAIEAVS